MRGYALVALSWMAPWCAGQTGATPVPNAATPTQTPVQGGAATPVSATEPRGTGALPEAPSTVQQQQEQETALPQTHTEITVTATEETEEERRERIHDEAAHDLKIEEKQRILVVVPNFTTVMTGSAVPLSKGQKLDLALHTTFDPFNLVGAFVLGGASEITGADRGFGWGAQGYFKRVGANVADVVDGTMLAGVVYPVLLRQDPRYFRQVTGSTKARVRHALLSSVICRGDNGRRQPNFSNVLGNFSAGLLSNLYYPSNETGVGLALENSSIVTAEGAFGNIALEFSPDVAAWWHRRRAAAVGAQAPAGQVGADGLAVTP